jgi:hypothetical protein
MVNDYMISKELSYDRHLRIAMLPRPCSAKMLTQDVTPNHTAKPALRVSVVQIASLCPFCLVYKGAISICRHAHRGFKRTLAQLDIEKYVNSRAQKEALLRAHRRMAHVLDHGEY